MKYTIVGIIFVVIALYWFFQNRSARKQYINVFSGRKSLSNEAFYNKYFKDQNIPDFIVYGVKRVLEEQLDTD